LAYQDDLARVRDILLEVVGQNPMCLHNPKPMFHVLGFEAQSIEVRLSVWVVRQNWIELRTELAIAIQQALIAHGVALPVQQHTVLALARTAPPA
jgi:small-conductance mechanosensitive channel